ncbi:hypothetical protein DXG01_009167 [Tephrocybe rancida]|nr:hypothetical protein DXG01_009167 [Tephrocybe rancida]
MTPDDEKLLREIGVLLLGNLAGFTAMTLVYGMSSPFAHFRSRIRTTILHFFLQARVRRRRIPVELEPSHDDIFRNRGMKNRITKLMFCISLITFLIATVYWCAYLASFATLVRGILVDTDIGPLDTGSFDGINHKNLRFTRMQDWTAQLLPMISDAVLLWRVRVMYPTKPWILIAPIIPLIGTIGSGFGLLGVMSTQPDNVTGVLGATEIWRKIYLSYLSLSLVTNTISAALIFSATMQLEKSHGNIGATLNMSQFRVYIIILLESGVCYAASQAINLAFQLVKPSSDSSLYFAAIVITSIYAVCTAMYPTVALTLVTIQRSIPHLFGQVPIIAKPSSGAAAKGAGGASGRQATMGNLAFAQNGTTHHTAGTDVTSAGPQIISFVVGNGHPEKARTMVDSSENLDEKPNEKQVRSAP